MSKPGTINCDHSERLALCAAVWPEGMATLAAEIVPGEDGKGPEWVRLLPLGKITPNDGREPWTLPAENADAVIAASKRPGLIDADHGTQTKGDSRAFGWLTELSARNPKTQQRDGIYGRVDWTKLGDEAFASKIFRFFSPTFFHDKARVITRIVGGSLVNNPALDELPALASTQQENQVDLAKLRTMLGLSDTATVDEIMAKLSQVCTQATAAASLTTRFTAVCAAAGITFDATKFGDADQLAICTKLRLPGDNQELATLRSQVNELNGTIVSMRGNTAFATAETKVTAAIASGKLVPAQKGWALGTAEKPGYAVTDPVGFDEMMSKQPTILSEGRVRLPADPAKAGELDADEVAFCSRMGLDPEKFKAEKAKNPLLQENAA